MDDLLCFHLLVPSLRLTFTRYFVVYQRIMKHKGVLSLLLNLARECLLSNIMTVTHPDNRNSYIYPEQMNFLFIEPLQRSSKTITSCPLSVYVRFESLQESSLEDLKFMTYSKAKTVFDLVKFLQTKIEYEKLSFCTNMAVCISAMCSL